MARKVFLVASALVICLLATSGARADGFACAALEKSCQEAAKGAAGDKRLAAQCRADLVLSLQGSGSFFHCGTRTKSKLSAHLFNQAAPQTDLTSCETGSLLGGLPCSSKKTL